MFKEGITDSLESTDNIISDNWFKSAAKFKGIAALLISNIIEEYNGLNITDIAKLIIDKHERVRISEDDVLGETIDLEPSESGDGVDKNIRSDIVFKMQSTQNRKKLLNLVTINFEIQSSAKEYNMISRAIYYLSHLLKNTIQYGESYTKIHKVYTIWFCNFKLENGMIDDGCIKQIPIHRYRMARHFTYNGKMKCTVDPIADLMEAVMIEIPKLRVSDNPYYNMIYNVFTNTNRSLPMIEEVAKINLTKYKEVNHMFDVAEEVRLSKEQGTKVEQIKTMQGCIEACDGNKEKAISLYIKIRKISKEEAIELYNLAEN